MAKKPRKFGAGGMTAMEKRITAMDKPTRAVPPAKKPAPKKSTASASPPLPNWMLRGDNEDKAPGERGGKKYAKGGSVKKLAAGGLGSPPVPQPNTAPFKGGPPPPAGMPAQGSLGNDARVAPPQFGGPGGPQMRAGPGSRPTMPQRPMMSPEGNGRGMDPARREKMAAMVAQLKQGQLRDKVWGAGSANSLNPVANTGKPPAPAAPQGYTSQDFLDGKAQPKIPGSHMGFTPPAEYDDMAAARNSGALDKFNAERAGPGPMTPERQAALSAAMKDMPNTKPGYKKGGVVKKFAKGGSVKSRGDGCAQRGRTKGKVR